MRSRIKAGRLKRALSQLPGRFCAPALIAPSRAISPGQPIAISGASLMRAFAALSIERSMDLDQPVDRFLPLGFVLRMPPQLEGGDLGARQIGRALGVQLDDAGADVGAADVDRQQAAEALVEPRRRQVRAADQARFIGMRADWQQIDLDPLAFQDHHGAPDDQFADRLCRMPPPTTMRSVSRQVFRRR